MTKNYKSCGIICAQIVTILALYVFGASATAAPYTVTFQQGILVEGESYTGTQDTYLYEWEPDRSYGSSNPIAAGGGDARPILRFDVSVLPPDAEITSATLFLYCSGTGSTPGLIGLYRMARTDWIVYKATWNKYDSLNPWTTAGGDYDPTLIDSWNPAGNSPGWADYDVTGIVQGYVDGIYDPEAGFLLKSTGASYDFTYFKSSEEADQSLRPKLVVDYTSDAPIANAGSDQDVGNNVTVTLDGTASSDPNETQKELAYSWHFLSIPWDSNLTDSDIQPNNTTGTDGADIPTFTVDALGDYEVKLTVTNSLGLSSSDVIKITSFYVKPEHPRIWLTPERLATLKARAAANTAEWQRFKDAIDGDTMGDWSYIISNALAYQVTDDTQYADRVIQRTNSYLGYDISEDFGYNSRWLPPNVAIGFDWCYDYLTEEQKTTYVNQLNDWRDVYIEEETWADTNPADNYFYGDLVAQGLTGLATYGDNPRAEEFIDETRWDRFEGIVLPFLNTGAKGGDWSEGWNYGEGAVGMYLGGYVEAVKTVTGENLFESTPYFEEVVYLMIHITFPTSDRIYPAGDWSGVNHMGWIDDFNRMLMLRVGGQFTDKSIGQYAQWWLNHVYTQMDSDTMLWEDFFWYDPDVPEIDYRNALSPHYFSPGTGLVAARGDWSEDATWVSFKCGPRRGDHSHFDQNSFTIFKNEWLAPDVNIYSASGILQGTYVHNSMLIDDKGQTGLNYGSAIMEKYEASEDYVYAVGEASGAYNSDYNGNILEDFTREFVYLRPDYVVILDRVTTVDANSSKKWLLHFKNEPAISGNLVTGTNEGGKLFSKTLLPQDYTISKTGKTLGYPDIRAWQVEVQPTQMQNSDVFLHVLYATDVSTPSMPEAIRIGGTTLIGAQTVENVVMFSREETRLEGGQFDVTGSGIYRTIIADLIPNASYDASIDGTPLGRYITTSSGLLAFDLPLDGNHSVIINSVLTQATGTCTRGDETDIQLVADFARVVRLSMRSWTYSPM